MSLKLYLKHFLFVLTYKWAWQVGEVHYTWQEELVRDEHFKPTGSILMLQGK